MDDLISRQQAIDALNDEYHGMVSDESMKIYQIINWLDNLPSAELQERKTGKWIIKDDTERFIAQCNCCRYIEDSRRIKNYCPNCGADMRGVTT